MNNVYVADSTANKVLIAFPAGACDSTWHHVAVSHANAAITLLNYVDGALVGTYQLATAPAIPTTGNVLRIGWNGLATNSELFSGSISDARIYAADLSASSDLLKISQPPLVSYPNASAVSPSSGATIYSYACSPGWAGPNVSWVRSFTDGGWSLGPAGVSVSCSLCPAGTFTTSTNSSACTPCAAGLYGATSAMGSSTCTGPCAAGFYCPAGSTTANAFACSGVGSYCPAGSGAPVTVPSGSYSGPLATSPTQRSTAIACPPQRLCAGGILYPAVDISSTCPTGSLTTQLPDTVSSVAYGPVLAASTLGNASAGVTWTIVNTTVNDNTACSLAPFPPLLSSSGNRTQLAIGATAVSASACSAGFSVIVKAARTAANATTDPVYSVGSVPPFLDTCTVRVYPIVSLRSPSLTFCKGSITVPEREAVGSKYGTVVQATSPQTSTTLAYSFASSSSGPAAGVALPFGLDCNGTLLASSPVDYFLASTYATTIRVDNIGLGAVLSVFCNLNITISPRPVPPTIVNDFLSVYDLTPAGTYVGNIGAVDNNNVVPAANYSVVAKIVTPDPRGDFFAISAAGDITVKNPTGLDSFRIDFCTIVVNVSDAISWATYPVVISLMPSARPPVIVAQVRTVNDTLAVGATVPGAVAAFSAQSKAITFSVSDPTGAFSINSGSGVLQLQSALVYNTMSSYALTVTATDSSGLYASAVVTVNVLDTQKAPQFPWSSTSVSVAEYWTAGQSFGAAILATDQNRDDSIFYSITACSPLTWSALYSALICPFNIDPVSGRLETALSTPAVLLADRNATYPGAQFTYAVTVQAKDDRLPAPSSTTVAVTVSVIKIVPRLALPAAPITLTSSAQAAGSAVLATGPLTWTAYSASTLTYSISSAASTASTAEGALAFVINAGSGQISVATPAPAWNYNTKNSFTFTVKCLDSNTGLFTTGSVTVNLAHYNRAPSFAGVPAVTFVPAGTTGNVISAASYASDPDLALSPPWPGEALTYTLAAAQPNGNSFGAYGVVSSTGQIFVANATALLFAYNAITGATNYTLAVTACDAGVDGARLCATALFNISTTLGRIPPVVQNGAASIRENAPAGTTVFRVVATDDASLTLSYAITGGNVNSAFAINSATGVITVASGTLNFATLTSYSLTVSVTNAFASSTASIAITVVEVNKAPSIPAMTSMTVNENSNGGTVIGSITGSDPNAGDAGRLTYAISGVSPTTGAGFFAIGSTTGVITVASGALLDYEAASNDYTISLTVTDCGCWDTVNVLGTLSGTGVVVVSLLNTNDAPTTSDLSASPVPENAASALAVSLTASDQDVSVARQSLSFALSRTSSACWAFSSAAAGAAQFVPVSLPTVATTSGNVQTVYARVQNLASATATIMLSSGTACANGAACAAASTAAAIADRFEIRLSATQTVIARCSGVSTCATLVTSATKFITAQTPSTATPTSNVRIDVTYGASSTAVAVYGGASGGDFATSAATVSLSTTDSTAKPQLRSMGVAASAANVRFTGLCFANAAAGSLFSVSAATSSSASLRTTSGLDFETQTQGYGVEILVTDANGAIASGAPQLSPVPLSDYFTVIVPTLDVNEAPSFSSLSVCSAPTLVNSYAAAPATLNTASAMYAACFYVPENSPAGNFSALTVNSASDPDAFWALSNGVSQSLSYSLAGTNNVFGTNSIFSVGSASRVLSVVTGGSSVLNYEAQSLYALTAVVSDFATAPSSFPTLSGSAPVALYVTDVNEAPTISAQACTVQEQTRYNNAPSGTVVQCNGGAGGGVLTASDPDTPGSTWAMLRFSIVAGNSEGLFAVNATTGRITLTSNVTCCTGPAATASTLDFERKSSYALSVMVSDLGSPALTSTATVVISLIDVTEPPVLLPPFSLNITENLVGPENVGSPIASYDADIGQSATFSMTGGNGSAFFAVNPCSGQVSLLFGKVLDYEAVQTFPGQAYLAPLTFTVVITVTDNGVAPVTPALNSSATYIIYVVDADDPPVFTPSSLSVTLPENSVAGAVFSGTITVTDQDVFGGRKAWFNQTYSILNGNSDGLFGLTTSFPASSTQANAMTLTVAVTSAARAQSMLNFEDSTQNVFSLFVSAVDGGGQAAQPATVTITLTDVNEAPFFSASETLARRIDETCAAVCSVRSAGLAVGSALVAQDPDVLWLPSLQSLSYSLVSGSPFFQVAAGTGQVSLTAAGAATTALDFEVTPSFVLLVRVTDSLGLSALANVTVSLNNRNEPPVFNSVFGPQPGTSLSPFAFNLLENAAIGSAVGSAIPSKDPEDVLGAGLDANIIAGNAQGVFTIDSAGVIRVASTTSLVFEQTQSYSLTVQLKDSGAPEGSAASLTSNGIVNIAIQPVNFPPTITPASFSIPENSASGVAVGNVALFASDPNTRTPGFYLSATSFSILSQERTVSSPTGSGGANPFAISGTGALTVSGAVNLDFEAKATYLVVVQVMDAGGLKANATFTVTLTNVNEAPFWTTGSVGVNARETDAPQTLTPIASQFAWDQDLNVTANNEVLTYSIFSGNTNNWFSINPSSGQLSVVVQNVLLFGGAAQPLVVRVTDAGGQWVQATFTVAIIQNNHAPFFAQPQGYVFNISENQAYGTLVATVLANDLEWNSPALNQKVTYTLLATGSNINRAWPFAVLTAAGGTNNVNRGNISIAWDGSSFSSLFNLDFEAPAKAAAAGGGAVGFNVYTGTITATDNAPQSLSSTVPVTINVLDAPEAPYFNRSTRVPATGFFVVSIPEHTPLSAAVGRQCVVSAPPLSSNAANAVNGGVVGFDDDASDVGRLVYSLSSTALFSIAGATGVITGAAGATALDFETTKSYSLTLTVTDFTSRTDTATLTVIITDVNEVAVWNGTGIFFANGAVSPSSTLTWPENTVVGTVLGSARATDPDTPGLLTAAVVYSLVANAESTPFTINSATGAITLAAPLDWEDKQLWRPTVMVMDASASPLNRTLQFSIAVTDVNDLTITGLSVIGASGAVMNSSNPYFSTHSDVQLLMRAAGGARIVITGTNFGLTQRRLTADGFSLASEVAAGGSITATYYTTSGQFSTYTATACAITVANTEIQCNAAAGVGGAHQWRVAIALSSAITGAAPSNATSGALTSAYYPPTLTGATAAILLPTAGGTSISLTGRDFGPAGTNITVSYTSSTSSWTPSGGKYTATSCSVTSDAAASCLSAPGVGGGLVFQVQSGSVARQISAPFTGSAVAYALSTVTAALPLIVNTRATNSLNITGTNFGPAGQTDLVVRYSNAANWSSPTATIYTASGCVVAIAHTGISCSKSAEGVGVGLKFVVSIGGQTPAAPSANSISYQKPTITGISGPGSSRGLTQGNQIVYLTGDQFGPVTAADANGSPLPGAIVPFAQYGHFRTVAGVTTFTNQPTTYTTTRCLVTIAHSQMTCFTVPGTGNLLGWAVNVATQQSNITTTLVTDYAAPFIAYYTGAGSTGAATAGNQSVVVTGGNFGPAVAGYLQKVTYGQNGTDFTASGCSVTIADTQVSCTTAPGAGAGLRWLITVDGQVSTVPVTDYAPPLVTALSGPGSSNANTDGGETVVITGTNFATNVFLGGVTYGPSGVE